LGVIELFKPSPIYVPKNLKEKGSTVLPFLAFRKNLKFELSPLY